MARGTPAAPVNRGRLTVVVGLADTSSDPLEAADDPATEALALVGDAVDLYTARVADVADALRGRGTYPSRADVADAVHRLTAETVSTTAELVDTLTGGDVPGLLSMATAHEAGATSAAMRLVTSASDLGVSAARTRTDLAALLRGEDVDYGRYGLTREDLTPFRTLASDGERILVTEGMEAAAQAAASTHAKRGNRIADWATSPRHSEVDVCDDYVRGGPYLLTRWPTRPHPHCGCMPRNARRGTEAEVARATDASAARAGGPPGRRSRRRR